MTRLPVELVGGRDFHDLAQIHHQYPVGDVLDHRQVVGDEQKREPQLALQIFQQIENLRLHRHVERRHRLVADQQTGIHGQGPGDADALPLAAGELMRVAVLLPSVQPHYLQQTVCSFMARGRRAKPLGAERLLDDVAYGHARVERREWILKDDLQLPPHALHGPPVIQGREVQAGSLQPEQHFAGGGVEEAQNGAAGGRLAAAALADQPDRLAGRHVEADAVHRPHPADRAAQQSATEREVLLQAAHLQQEVVRCRRGVGAARGRAVGGGGCGRRRLRAVTGARFFQPTLGGVIHAHFEFRGLALLADFGGMRAPGCEVAALRQVGQVRNRTVDRPQPPSGADYRTGGQQPLGVGVPRMVEDLQHAAALGDLSGVHHHDLVSHFADHSQVMGNEHDRHPQPPLQILHQLQDLGLDGDVQGGGRFVGDQE